MGGREYHLGRAIQNLRLNLVVLGNYTFSMPDNKLLYTTKNLLSSCNVYIIAESVHVFPRAQVMHLFGRSNKTILFQSNDLRDIVACFLGFKTYSFHCHFCM